MFLNSGVDATSTSHLVLLESKCLLSSLCVWSWSSRTLFPTAIGTFSCRLAWEYPISDLVADRLLFPAAISTSVLSSVFSGLARYPKLCEEISSLLGSRATRHGLAFAIGEPSFEVVFWPRFDMVLCFLTWSSERKSLKCLQQYIEKLIMLSKQRRWFQTSREKLSLVRMSARWFLVSTYLIWISGPNLSCQTANQEQHCGFWTRVSSLDFVHWQSCWWQLHCLLKMWVHDPHQSIDQPFTVFWHLGSWFWNGESHQSPACHCVWVGQYCWLNVVLQSQRPKDQEQATHPQLIQHPEK